jgi:hypothetical protein
VRRTHRTVAVAALLALVSLASCATYTARPGRHIVLDAEGVYHRDGGEYRVGPWGGRADALVGGDARAAAEVRRHQRLSRDGSLIYALGLAAMIVGPVAAASQVSASLKEPVGFGTFGIGIGFMMMGIYVMTEGQVALLDAINIYNDDADAAAGTGWR